MSTRFLGRQAAALIPYVPGEQPQDRSYIKLNTNECPYPPSPAVKRSLCGIDERFRLYPDPENVRLKEALAATCGVDPTRVFVSNGSDETLAFAFFAFFDRGDTICFPDLSYGFYPVYADFCGLCPKEIPLQDDFTIHPEDYANAPGHILIANPNAPTGLALSRDEIERILIMNPDRLVMVDEAYADFAEDVSCLPLLEMYENLVVIGTLSKSRSLAGMRLGYAVASPELIAAFERIKYSFNPYNVNCATQAAATAALEDDKYFRRTVCMVKATRQRVREELLALGLRVLPSETNFLFVSHPTLSGQEFYAALKENGILVRAFSHLRTREFVRISIGADADMDALLLAIKALG